MERVVQYDNMMIAAKKVRQNKGVPGIDGMTVDEIEVHINPITLIKIPLLQYLFGIPSMRQTIQDIKVNVAYRWFLGLTLTDPVPHFSTFGKNYMRRFRTTDLSEQIFSNILTQCLAAGVVDASDIFIDGTHVKACANGRKYTNKEVEVKAKWLADTLTNAIQEDRQAHEKKPLKETEKESEV